MIRHGCLAYRRHRVPHGPTSAQPRPTPYEVIVLQDDKGTRGVISADHDATRDGCAGRRPLTGEPVSTVDVGDDQSSEGAHDERDHRS